MAAALSLQAGSAPQTWTKPDESRPVTAAIPRLGDAADITLPWPAPRRDGTVQPAGIDGPFLHHPGEAAGPAIAHSTDQVSPRPGFGIDSLCVVFGWRFAWPSLTNRPVFDERYPVRLLLPRFDIAAASLSCCWTRTVHSSRDAAPCQPPPTTYWVHLSGETLYVDSDTMPGDQRLGSHTPPMGENTARGVGGACSPSIGLKVRKTGVSALP